MFVFAFALANDVLVGLLGYAFARLALNSDLQRDLRADPGGVPAFVRECLRYGRVVPSVYRQVSEGTLPLGGAVIRVGERMKIDVGRANRDPDVFYDPNRFDPKRKARPNLAFAAGPHTCMGVSTTHRTAELLVTRLLERYSLSPSFESLTVRPSMLMRVYESLPITVRGVGRS